MKTQIFINRFFNYAFGILAILLLICFHLELIKSADITYVPLANRPNVSLLPIVYIFAALVCIGGWILTMGNKNK